MDPAKKQRIAWGVTGSGDKLKETVSVMKELSEKYEENVEVWVYLSKAGEHIVKLYGVLDSLKECFDKIFVESNSNVPFLAGQMQASKFKFLLVAPATSNTVAKIAVGIADTMLCNAVAMALKAGAPVFVMPTDLIQGEIATKLPNGRELKLRMRKEDLANVEKLRQMEGLTVIDSPNKIGKIFENISVLG